MCYKLPPGLGLCILLKVWRLFILWFFSCWPNNNKHNNNFNNTAYILKPSNFRNKYRLTWQKWSAMYKMKHICGRIFRPSSFCLINISSAKFQRLQHIFFLKKNASMLINFPWAVRSVLLRAEGGENPPAARKAVCLVPRARKTLEYCNWEGLPCIACFLAPGNEK